MCEQVGHDKAGSHVIRNVTDALSSEPYPMDMQQCVTLFDQRMAAMDPHKMDVWQTSHKMFHLW